MAFDIRVQAFREASAVHLSSMDLPHELLYDIMSFLVPATWAPLPSTAPFDSGWLEKDSLLSFHSFIWSEADGVHNDQGTTDSVDAGKNVFMFRGFRGVKLLVDAANLKAVRAAAGTCQAWRKAVQDAMATRIRRFAFRPDLSLLARPTTHERILGSLVALINAGLTTSCPPPLTGVSTLQKQLQSMQVVPGRFAGVEEIHFGNYVIDDNILNAVAGLFPALRSIMLYLSTVTATGIEALVRGCPKLETIELIAVEVDPADVARLANPNTLPALKTIHIKSFEPLNLRKQVARPDMPTVSKLAEYGLSACRACGGWYPTGSIEATCLVHTGRYSGYGSSCSSFSCCRSMQPGYP